MKLLQIGASGRQEEVEVPGVGAAIGDFASVVHAHAISDTTGLLDALGAKAPIDHTHTLASLGAAAASHQHGDSDLTELSWSKLTGVPSTFTPSSHDHAFDSLTSKPTTLAGYGIVDAALASYIPPGGTSGQVLAKASAADHDTVWADQAGGSGGMSPASTTVSLVEMIAAGCSLGTSPYTVGCEFRATQALVCAGVRFLALASTAYTARLWAPTGELLATALLTPSESGPVVASFPTPVGLAAWSKYRVSVYAAAHYWCAPAAVILGWPFWGGPAWQVLQGCNVSSDSYPANPSNGYGYPVEPVLIQFYV